MIVTIFIVKIMMKYKSIKEIVTGAPNDTQHQNNTHTQKSSPVDCDGVLLTNAQFRMVPISILWYREYWTLQQKVRLYPIYGWFNAYESGR